MPQRTRNHILEDKSRHAFNELIPEKWVVRDKGKDYGIDCEVEIFDDLGNPTGLIFYVQLKATESKSAYKVKNVAFEISKISQFQSYSIPVVIVRYSHLESKLYYTWANDVASQIRSDKKVTIRFNDQSTLDSQNIVNFQDYLIRHNKAIRGNFNIPINTYISLDNFDKETSFATLQFFKKIVLSKPNYFNLVRNERESILQLKIGRTKCYLSLSDSEFSSIGYNNEALSIDSDYITSIVLACFTIILYRSNKPEQANEIFFTNDLIKVLNLREDFLIYFLPHLLTGEKCEQVLDEIEGMFDITKDNTIQNVSLAILLLTKSQNPERQRIYQNFLLKQIEYAKAIDYAMGIGLSYYNLGNFHRNIGNIKEAIYYYLEARKFYPQYKCKGYYYFELAGLLFQMNKFLLSVKFYEKSIKLNIENVLVKALLSDALLYLGEFESAVTYIDQFLTEQKDNDRINKDEWYLKYFCIQTLILNGYPKTQKRDVVQSFSFLKSKKFDEAIECDMLCSEAWFENGLIANKNHKTIEAFLSFTMSALFDKNNILSWVFSTISGFIEGDEQFLHVIYVIRLAYFYHAENFIDSLFDYTEKNLKAFQEPLMKLVYQVIGNINKEELSIRFFENDSDYQVLSMY